MIKKSRSPGVRLAIAESMFDEPRIQDRRAHCWFRCGRVNVQKMPRKGRDPADTMGYPTYQPWQDDLAAEVEWDGEGDFEPDRVPIILRGPDPMDWIDLHLASWSQKCTGRHMLCGAYSPKSPEFLETPEQAAALEAQGFSEIDPELSEFWIGKAVKDKKIITCDPLLCEFFRNPDAEIACKPVIDFSFLVDWATDESTASYYSRAWGSLNRLTTSINDVQNLLRSAKRTLARATCWLKVERRPSAIPGTGQPIFPPAVKIDYRGDLKLLELEAKQLAELPEPAALVRVKSLHELREERLSRLAADAEFTPEAHAAQMSAEEAFFERWRPHLGEAVINKFLHDFDTDLDGADAAAEAMVRAASGKTEPESEEPIDADFTVEEPDELEALMETFREAVADIPKDVQKAWFEEVGATRGQPVTIEQAKELVKKAGGAS
jgi:hypothetical protein